MSNPYLTKATSVRHGSDYRLEINDFSYAREVKYQYLSFRKRIFVADHEVSYSARKINFIHRTNYLRTLPNNNYYGKFPLSAITQHDALFEEFLQQSTDLSVLWDHIRRLPILNTSQSESRARITISLPSKSTSKIPFLKGGAHSDHGTKDGKDINLNSLLVTPPLELATPTTPKPHSSRLYGSQVHSSGRFLSTESANSKSLFEPMPFSHLGLIRQAQHPTKAVVGGRTILNKYLNEIFQSIKSTDWVLPYVIPILLLFYAEDHKLRDLRVLFQARREDIPLENSYKQSEGVQNETTTTNLPEVNQSQLTQQELKTTNSSSSNSLASLDDDDVNGDNDDAPQDNCRSPPMPPSLHLPPSEYLKDTSPNKEKKQTQIKRDTSESLTLHSSGPIFPIASCFPSYQYLSTVFMAREAHSSKDPIFWIKSHLFLIDGFLFQCDCDRNYLIPMGFLFLDENSVRWVDRHLRIRETTTTANKVTAQGYIVVQVSMSSQTSLTTSNGKSKLSTFFFASTTGETCDSLQLYQILLKASQLTIYNSHDFTELNIVAKGRYSEIYECQSRFNTDPDQLLRRQSDPPLPLQTENSLLPLDELSSKETTSKPDRAIKLISKKEYNSAVVNNEERSCTLLREIVLLWRANYKGGDQDVKVGTSDDDNDHEEVRSYDKPFVKIYGILETRDHVAIELERMEKQTLFDVAVELGHLSEKQTRHIAIQLVQAVYQLNQYDIAHRDIKLLNICFPYHSSTTSETKPPSHEIIGTPPSPPVATAPPATGVVTADLSPENSFRKYQQLKSSSLFNKLKLKHFKFDVKLIDFGMAGYLHEDGLLRGRCGTIGRVAPEILNCSPEEGYSEACDMYSIGVVLYSLFTGYTPFYGDTEEELLFANKLGYIDTTGSEWSSLSSDGQNFILSCLQHDPSTRLTPYQAFHHPWLKNVYGLDCLEGEYPPQTLKHKRTKKSNHKELTTCLLS